MIYIIFGASGSGKTTLLHSVKEHLGDRAINMKATTREIRSYDDIEVVSYPEGIPKSEYEYFYNQYGNEYAIDKNQLEEAVRGNYHHFVICNDVPTIKKIKEDFKFMVKVIYLDFDAPEDTIRTIQERRGINDDEIKIRISKIEYLKQIWIDNLGKGLFDEIIVNRFGTNPETNLWPQLERIIGDTHHESNFEVIQQTIDYLVELINRKEAIHTIDPSLVESGFLFIIMAMEQPCLENESGGKVNQELFDILSTIKAVASDCKMRAQLADAEYVENKLILTKIIESIKKAEIIIADLSYERPNCYFELGYAMAVGKKIIITAKVGTKIHFDVSGYEIIYYEDTQDLYRQLKMVLLNRK